jgi:membrane protein implicated in regulation of membrane protease activity
MALSQTFWLIAGSVLCGIELFVPMAFSSFVLGLSALVVGFLVPVLPSPALQIGLWMLLSLILFLASRRLVSRSRLPASMDAIEAETLTEIPPGKTGRVLYEGNSWPAQCEDPQLAIAAHQKVYVVRNLGNILLVVPENLLHLPD